MTKQTMFVPTFAKTCDALSPYVLPLLRVTAGLTFATHGFAKLEAAMSEDGLTGLAGGLEAAGFIPGIFWAWLATLTEAVGGLAIALGLYTRAFALGAAVMMYLITFVYKAPEALTIFFQHKGGIEYDLMLAVVFTVFVVLGGGRWSLDGKLPKTF